MCQQLGMLCNENLHLDVKDHVPFDTLESMWNIPAILQSIEFNSDILHFFCNGIRPKGGARVSVNGQGIVHQLWQRKVILVLLPQVCDIASFDSEMIKLLFLMTQNTHQLKPGSNAIPIWIANLERLDETL